MPSIVDLLARCFTVILNQALVRIVAIIAYSCFYLVIYIIITAMNSFHLLAVDSDEDESDALTPSPSPSEIESDHEEEIKTGKLLLDDLRKMRHPLKHSWTLWYLDDRKDVQWLERLHQVATVDTLEGFLTLHKSVRPPSKLLHSTDYNFFCDGIMPVWECPANSKGGKWQITVDKKHPHHFEILDFIWTEILLAMVGEQFGQFGSDIRGVVLNVRHKGSKVCVWTANALDDYTNSRIGHIVKEKLVDSQLLKPIKGPLFDRMTYITHDESQSRQSSIIKRRQIEIKYTDPTPK